MPNDMVLILLFVVIICVVLAIVLPKSAFTTGGYDCSSCDITGE